MYEIMIGTVCLVMVILNYANPIPQAIWAVSSLIIYELIKIRKLLEQEK